MGTRIAPVPYEMGKTWACHYWKREVHISEVVVKVLNEIKEKWIINNTQEETF